MISLKHNRKLLIVISICWGALLFSGKTFAAWYQAEGQALVKSGDIKSARREATNEAVRQALLFSGASVSSTQTLVNGLMSNEAIHVDAFGEVKRVEKVKEKRQDGILSVTIRADIFPKKLTCSQSDPIHSLVTSKFRVKHPGQLLAGNIQSLNGALLQHFEQLVKEESNVIDLETILPFTLDWKSGETIEHALALGRQHNVQLALFGEIEDTSLITEKRAWFKGGAKTSRQFRLRVELVDTINGAVIHQAYYTTSAVWRYGHHESVNPVSPEFWQSEYGAAIHGMLIQLVTDMEDVTSCQPSTGRILSVVNNQVVINMGREHHLSVGDEVTLYQKNQLFDEFGRKYVQYNVHPDKLRVVSVNVDNAIVEPESGGLLGNIQPNDFVTRK
ncbi:flagellar assembly protein T N-terminal domain-containing protein [Alteromonas sp. 5E99-2]|uniref:flagellar assembly protein T N-terminal domain-containing protein n=1 Tax=Alteromonas sp. 5E99-2 TaxID=2817683 RepID=UPI001A99926D|nr:flagellar assembly protein T N-terminal domain-containing protein [Alteromonas sp. 5E99-2]MBO1254081.1 flagellar assembly protein T N-terminal domain-containing protein [Alteromonas sp. 5E99-2]